MRFKLHLIRIIGLVSATYLFTSCDKQHDNVIAKIPEASGVSYCSNTNTLVVANDEGAFFELNTDGTIIQKQQLGDYDFEGVVCEDDRLIFAIEDKGLLLLDRKTLQGKLETIEPIYKGKKIKLMDKKNGIEGIAKVGNDYYLSKQSKKKEDSYLLKITLDDEGAKIVERVKHGVLDSAGMEYHNGSLYIVSDKKDTLIRYDLKQQKILCQAKLEESSQEGITFDNDGHFYIADDDGALLKYNVSQLPKECIN